MGRDRLPRDVLRRPDGRLVGERIQGGVDLEHNQEAFQRGVALALGAAVRPLRRRCSPRVARARGRRRPPARAPSPADLEAEIVCPTCKTTLDQSDSPIARRMKANIRERIAAGATRGEIKDELVAEFGPGVLAEPPKRGFDLLAWLLPLGILGRRRGRRRGASPGAGAGGAPATTAGRSCARPGAGAARRRRARAVRRSERRASGPSRCSRGSSPSSPRASCRSYPGYLSAVSAVEADRLGQPGHGAPGRRLERAVRARVHGRVRRPRRRRGARRRRRCSATSSCSSRSPASSSSSSGSPSWGCCPGRSGSSARGWSRARAPRARGCCSAARSRSARRRASGRCSPRILVLAGSSGTAARGRAPARRLLARARDPVRARRRRCSPARWARSAGCATTTVRSSSRAALVMVALGLLLFFGRFYCAADLPQPRLRVARSSRRSSEPAGRDRRLDGACDRARFRRVATILLVGVDLFFRGKLEGCSPGIASSRPTAPTRPTS